MRRSLLLVSLLLLSVLGLAPQSSGVTPLAANVLVFNSNRPGGNHNYEIFKMNKDGTGQTALTSNAAYDSWWPKPSPDRTQILFVRSPAGTHDGDPSTNTVWKMNADGTGLTQILPLDVHGWNTMGHPEWSPNGTKIVLYAGPVTSNPEIYTVNADGTNPIRISNNGAGGPRDGANTDPVWSPDGTKIAFNGCQLGMNICLSSSLEIHVMNADGTGEVRLTTNNQPDYDPAFSPDGTKIAWLQNTGSPTRWGIKKMNPNGTSQTTVIDDGKINSKPAWDIDGTWIYFHRAATTVPGYVFNVWKIKPDGTSLTEIILPRPPKFSNNMSEYPVNGLN